jgi:cytoskeleton protein RodZ
MVPKAVEPGQQDSTAQGDLQQISQTEDETREEQPEPSEPAAVETAAVKSAAVPEESAELAAEDSEQAVANTSLTEIDENTELILSSTESALAPGVTAVPENKLLVTIKNQTWLDIRDVTGAKLIYRTVEAGELLNLVGQPPFYVFIGAIEGVGIEYIGEPVVFKPDASGVFARFRVGSALQ